MKVLVVSPYYDTHGGGVEKVAARLASEVAHFGASVTWCSLDCGEGLPKEDSVNIVKLRGSNIIERKLNFPYPLISFFSLLKLWKEIRKSDVIHLHDYIYFSNIFGFLAAKMSGKRVLITQHIGMINYQSKLLRFLLSTLNRTVGALILSRASGVVFISDHVKEYFDAVAFRTNLNWHYIPNGVDVIDFRPDNQRGECLLPAARKQILFVGRFVEKKGMLFLKEIVRKLDMFDWIFVGRGPVNPQAWGLAHVRVVGHVNDKKYLADIYRQASLLVLPSHGEGFPLVVQEAVASGVPVLTSLDVATGCRAAKKYLFIEDIWAKEAEARWVSRIESILREPADREKLNSAVIFARENWSWSQIAMKYIRLYA